MNLGMGIEVLGSGAGGLGISTGNSSTAFVDTSLGVGDLGTSTGASNIGTMTSGPIKAWPQETEHRRTRTAWPRR